MISSGNGPQSPAVRFLPHQKAFLELFFNPASKRIIFLRADVGLGKGVTLVALANQLLRERPTARVLFVVSRVALAKQFEWVLQKENTLALLVDRYKFREMLDSASGGGIWPSGMVAVLTLDFAQQTDIRDSLAKTHWDLVIVDDERVLKVARAKVFRKILGSADRVILTSGPTFKLPNAFPAEDSTLVEWQRYQLVGCDGKPLDTMPAPVLHEIPYNLSEAELSLKATVINLCEILEHATASQKLRAMTLRRRLESSPAALEETLQRFIERSSLLENAQQSFGELPEASEEEWLEHESR